MKNIFLYILIILYSSLLKSDDLKSYKIIFLDITNDLSYSKWGIHPVDIRSNLKKEKRALAGAKLAIQDSKKLRRLTKTDFILKHKRVKDINQAFKFIESESVNSYDAVLLDLRVTNVEKLIKILNKKSKIIFFNISDPNNDLRKKVCLKNYLSSYPSYKMLTDSLSQYLIKKKLNKTLMLTGPLPSDLKMSTSFKESAEKFGLRIIKENFFVNNNDPRVRDKNNLSYLTKEKRYNNVFVSDTDGEFALSVQNATIRPALVSGSSGLVPRAWHWSYLRHGAPQLNGRFERMNNRRMEGKDWAAWISIKTIVESVLRIQDISNNNILTFINSNKIQIDGSKGISLNYRNGTNQLRQTILLTSSNNWVTAKAPLNEFQNSDNNLDTIGLTLNETQCGKEE
ncbi:MAG: hypothetical protein CMP36_03615 [Rickettsiales bacterium]|nr:hypothetical protein [Rickettsiales bacterium]OUV78985.1 MAG: hypothetical protein CBC91_04385 [Rickettsiales bacterium TMED131]|tara:strand:+ start:986 stop:2179 length:1194 start_codon:yes stop_codon:yes gene_type:complete